MRHEISGEDRIGHVQSVVYDDDLVIY